MIVATGVLFALAAAIAVGDRSVLFGCYALGTAVMLAAFPEWLGVGLTHGHG